MPNHAHATIIGHAGRDAETRYLENGDPVTEVSVAVAFKRKGKEVTTWWRVVVFGKPTEWAAEIKKGDLVFVSGQPEMEEWTDKDGNKRQALKLFAREIVGHGKWRQHERSLEPEPKQERAPEQEQKQDVDDDIPF